MRLLVTGAAGFVGSHLVGRLLEDGHDVVAILRPGTDTWRIRDFMPSLRVLPEDLGSPRLPEGIAEVRPEACIHLAWFAVPGRYLDGIENLQHLEMSLGLIRALTAAQCARFVGIGTCLEYALEPKPLDESQPTRPTRLYAVTKLALATVLDRLRDTTGMSVAWARLFYVYGPREDERRLVPSVLRSLLSGAPTRVTEGGQVRDYLHVSDVAGALAALASSTVEGPVNIGSGSPLSVRDLVVAAARAVGREDLAEFGAVASDPRDPSYVCADNRRLVREVGFTPQVTLPEGLRDTAAWWASRLAPAGSSGGGR